MSPAPTMSATRPIVVAILLQVPLLAGCGGDTAAQITRNRSALAEVEAKLKPLAEPLPKLQPEDWLAEHKEAGQTFAQYVTAKPVRKSDKLRTIYICQLGDFSPKQEQILDVACEYLSVVYQVPVKRHCKLALLDIPARARRTHPQWGDKQILTTFVLDEILERSRPDDALAYLAFSIRKRTGILSLGRRRSASGLASGQSIALAIHPRMMPTSSSASGEPSPPPATKRGTS